eukprot:1448285-Amphidinium_carterae.2
MVSVNVSERINQDHYNQQVRGLDEYQHCQGVVDVQMSCSTKLVLYGKPRECSTCRLLTST